MRRQLLRQSVAVGVLFVLAAVYAYFVSAATSASFVNPTPLSGADINGTVVLNATFIGSGNVTFSWATSPSGPWNAICSNDEVQSPRVCSWDTTTVADRKNYLINVTVVNASNASDYSVDVVPSLTIDNTPPEINLSYPENNSVVNATVLFNWSVADRIDTEVNCSLYIDDAYNSSYVSINETWIAVPAGDHLYYLNCSDYMNQTNVSVSRNFTVDDQAPSVIMEYPFDGYSYNNSDPFFNWTISDDHALNVSCELFIDGDRQIIFGNETTNYTSPLSEGSHDWQLNCTDDVGNRNVSSLVTFYNNITVNPHFVPPSPVNGSNVSGTIEINTTFNQQSIVQIYYNSFIGGGWQEIYDDFNLNSPINVTWDTTSASDGDNYSLRLYVQAASQPEDFSTVFLSGITVDNTPPSLELDYPVNNSFVAAANVMLNWTLSDTIDQNVSCALTIDELFNTTFYNETNVTLEFPDGTHSWNITCTDYTGNQNVSAVRVFHVDTVFPQILAFNATPDIANHTNASPLLNMTVNESNLLACHYRLNDSDMYSHALSIDTNGNISYCYGNVPAQAHGTSINITFRAIDEGNNTIYSNASINMTVDTIQPWINITLPLPATLTTDGQTLIINATVIDQGAGVASDSPCAVRLGSALYTNESGVFSGVVLYNATTGSCVGNITLSDPSGLAVTQTDDVDLRVYVSDYVSNQNYSLSYFVLDNIAPAITANTTNWTNNAVENENSSIVFSITTYDTSSPQWARMGNETIFDMQNTTPQGSIVDFSFVTTPATLGCPDTGACEISFYLNDSWNNSYAFNSMSIVIDDGPPQYSAYGINQSGTAHFDERIYLFADWLDESLESSQYTTATLYKAFDGGAPTAQDTIQLNNNNSWSNFTYYVNPSYDEGETLHFFIEYTDLAGFSNQTPNMSLVIENRSPYVVDIDANGLIGNISNESPTLRFSYGDEGSGIDSIMIGIQGSQTYNYTQGYSCVTLNTTILGVAQGDNLTFNTSQFNLTEYSVDVLAIEFTNETFLDNVTFRRDYRGSSINTTVYDWVFSYLGNLHVESDSYADNGVNYTNVSFVDLDDVEYLCTFDVPVELAEGSYNMTLVVRDGANNTNASSFSWEVDGARPTIVNLTAGSEWIIRDNVTQAIIVNASEPEGLSVNWSVFDTYLNRTSLRFFMQGSDPVFYDNTSAVINSTRMDLAPGHHLGYFQAYDITGDSYPTSFYFQVYFDTLDNMSGIRDGLINRFDVEKNISLSNLTILRNGNDISLDEDTAFNESIQFLFDLNVSSTNYSIQTNGVDGMAFNWNNTFGFSSGDSSDPRGAFIQAKVGITIDQYIATAGYHDSSDEKTNGTYYQDQFLPVMGIMQPTNWSFNASDEKYIVAFDSENVEDASTDFYQLMPCANVTTNISSWDQACYINQSYNYTVYTPQFTGIAFGTDAGAPNITVNSPLTFVDNSFFTLNFSVIEPAPNTTFCTYDFRNDTQSFVNETLYAANFTLEGAQRFYARSFTNISDDGTYLINITCVDAYDRSTTMLDYFGLQDNVSPVILGVNASEPRVYDIYISAQASELSRARVNFDTVAVNFSSSTLFTDYGYNHTIFLDGLSENTRYYYQYEVCDYQDNCAFSSTGSFRTEELIYTDRGAGGGGGGSGSILPGTIIASNYRGWSVLPAGWLRYDLEVDDMPVTGVGVFLDNATANAYIQLQSYFGRPRNVDDAQDITYQYFQVVSNRIKEHASKFELEFRVPTAWLTNISAAEDDVHLFRYENKTWKEYDITHVKKSSGYDYFSVQLPSFSFFAITADGVLPSEDNYTLEPTPGLGEDQPYDGGEIYEEDDQAVEDLEDENGDDTGAVVGYEGDGLNWWWFIAPFIVILLGVGGVVIYYKQKYGQTAQTVQNVAKPEARSETDPLYPLQVYIDHALNHGHKAEEIRQKLLATGWDDIVVEEEIDNAMMRRI